MLDPAGLLALLETEAVLLLPTAHAARSLRERFDRQQRDRDLPAWDTPPIYAWDAWTATLWSNLTLDGADDRVLLNRLQEEMLWADIIPDPLQTPPQSPFQTAPQTPLQAEVVRDRSSLRELAQLARSAFALAAAHEALDRLPRAADSFDSRAFASWQRAFLRRCHTERLLPQALLESALTQHAREGRLSSVAPLHLAGFDQLTPAQEHLLTQLSRCGTTLTRRGLHRSSNAPPRPQSLVLETPEAELDWALRTVRALGAANGTDAEPIAIVLPDPSSERAALEPRLRDALAPELEPVAADLSSTPWHISGGDPLARVPVVRDALSLLRWLTSELPIEEISALLLSPFFSHEDDLETRARFDIGTLREAVTLRPELRLGAFLELARRKRRDATSSVPRFASLVSVQDLLATARRQRQTASFGDWSEFTRTILRTAGWPGPRTQSPAEFRATEAWESVLDLLATLDLRGRRTDLRGFLALLRREAETLPLPSGTEAAPVQILRLADTAGCFFSTALLLRATDDALPTTERPHPLLGWALQQSLGLPGADPARTQSRARHLVESLQSRSGQILFSHASTNSNGELRPSPLIAALGAESAPAVTPIAVSPALTPIEVPDDTPLPPLPSPCVEGGARVLELQAACGFRAFADLRLAASEPERRSPGLDPRNGGTYLHRALELLWRGLATQAALRALSESERHARVSHAVAETLLPLRSELAAAEGWTQAFLDVLQQRYTSLLLFWLDHELKRGDFSVLPLEQKRTVAVGPLQLTIRPDRIDAVPNGRVYVDYKTSPDLNTKDWLGERPRYPQLPLYALLSESEPSNLRGLAFARVRPGNDMAWISLEDEPGIFPARPHKPQHNLEDQMKLWRAELDRLAASFAQGDTRVDPKSYPHTCKYCGHRLLCRLDPATLLANADGTLESDNPEDSLG